MKPNKIIPYPVFMLLSIIGIAAFQFYWLKQNYLREEKTMNLKAEVVFRQTLQDLQVSRLKLGGISKDSLHVTGIKYMISEDGDSNNVTVNFPHKEEILSTINVIKSKIADSVDKGNGPKPGMIISIKETTRGHPGEEVKSTKQIMGDGPDRIMQFLYGIDSLQVPLNLKEIDAACSISMKEQNLDFPFSIIKLDSPHSLTASQPNEVTLGFAKPITYKLQLGNTVPFILKKLVLPIFFSLLLLSITILSFVVLYRNMMKQRRLGELKNEFISNITHELKTPIATAGVAIEALKNFNAMDDPGRTKEYLDISSNELQRLSLLVEKVLNLSLLEKKEIALQYQPVNLKAIVEEVVSSLKLQFEKYHAKVTVSSEGNMGLQGDAHHLMSVIFNLLDNALKYGNKSPVIQIKLTEKVNSLLLEVADNGIGIAPEYKEKVFEKFFRIPHGDTHNAKGYGLGLSYANQIIQKHKGTIIVESMPGVETKFIISLPKA